MSSLDFRSDMDTGCLYSKIYRVRETYEVEQGMRQLVHMEELDGQRMVPPFFVHDTPFKPGDVLRVGVMYEKVNLN